MMSDDNDNSSEPEDRPRRHLNRVRATTLISHPTDDKGKLDLMVMIDLACSHCELRLQWSIPGHHLESVLKALQKAKDDYPELCKAHVEEVPAEPTDKRKVM